MAGIISTISRTIGAKIVHTTTAQGNKQGKHHKQSYFLMFSHTNVTPKIIPPTTDKAKTMVKSPMSKHKTNGNKIIIKNPNIFGQLVD